MFKEGLGFPACAGNEFFFDSFNCQNPLCALHGVIGCAFLQNKVSMQNFAQLSDFSRESCYSYFWAVEQIKTMTKVVLFGDLFVQRLFLETCVVSWFAVHFMPKASQLM